MDNLKYFISTGLIDLISPTSCDPVNVQPRIFRGEIFLYEFVDFDLLVEAVIKEPVRLSPVDRVEGSRGQDFNILKKNSSPL